MCRSSAHAIWVSVLLLFIASCDPSTEIDVQPATDQQPVDQIDDADDTQSPPDTSAIRYLALGDSYTTGTGIVSYDGWPERLVESLRESGYSAKEPVIVARAGWTTARLLLELDNLELQPEYDLVSLQIGVNNQYNNQGIAVFKRDFEVLLDLAADLTKSGWGVFVLSIPDYGATPFGSGNAAAIGKEIDAYNEYIMQVCTARNIRYYDVTEISRRAAEYPALLSSDQLHPSGDMYQLWVDKITPGILSLIDRLRS